MVNYLRIPSEDPFETILSVQIENEQQDAIQVVLSKTEFSSIITK